MEFTKGQSVYVSSSDSRQKGFNGTILSIGSKYITVTNNYGRKYRFDREGLYCIDWGVYHLEESEQSYNERMLRYHKLNFIIRNDYRLGSVLSEDEIDEIYNRIIQHFGEQGL